MAGLRFPLCLFALAALGAPAAGADAERVARDVDRLLEARWAAHKVRPAAAATDAEFLRRAWLDLAGSIPSVPEARAFLDDPSPDKRRRLVERLLGGPSYATHFAHAWRAAWLPESENDPALTQRRAVFEGWLRGRLGENAGYDKMVREILTRTPADRRAGGPAPTGFYEANENKPENLAASASRLFLGFRLECAQCHDHFFAPWKREQFWQLAAFFAGPRRAIGIPNTGKVVQARFPDGTEPPPQGALPAALADWMMGPNNPYFARAAVNRVWAHFFGAGLVDPVDDMPAGQRDEVLDALAKEFAASGFDLKFLIRVVVGTRAYQLSSAGPPDKLDASAHFARMPVRLLTPEQVLASLGEATGAGRGDIAELVASFGKQPGGRPGVSPSVTLALALMNGKAVNDATGLEQSNTLAAVAHAPFLDTAERVEALYLAALSRRPTPAESSRLVRFVEKGGDPQRALGDVFWALLNSGEFILNH